MFEISIQIYLYEKICNTSMSVKIFGILTDTRKPMIARIISINRTHSLEIPNVCKKVTKFDTTLETSM